MSRSARSAPVTLEAKLAAAKEEVARAETALAFRKSQLEEAQAELAGLDGIGGWIPALLGRKGALRAELEGKVKALQSESLALRAKLIEARKARADLERAEGAEAQSRAARDAELERFADRVRESHHPIRDELLAIEAEIQGGADHLFDLTEAFRACSGLSARVGEVARATGHARRYAAYDFVDIPGAQTLAFLKTREAQAEATTIPEAIARFNDACAQLGLAPMQIDVSTLPTGWLDLVADGLLTDYLRMQKLAEYSRELETLRELARDTSLRIAEWRTSALAEQEERIQRRRTLLDEALR